MKRDGDRRQLRYPRTSPAAQRQLLIDAAIRCLGRGGILAFTVDQISREAGVSRGLINHHFKREEDLLVSVYESMTEYLYEAPRIELTRVGMSPRARLTAMINAALEGERGAWPPLRARLTLWGEIPANPRLRAMHGDRRNALKLGLIEVICTIAMEQGRELDGEPLARMLMALLDGLWLQRCLDPDDGSLANAKVDCYRLVEISLAACQN